ncbi:MAG: YidB family protein [Stellaceae bacterium]
MGLLDDVLGSAVPGGNLAKPLMVGLAALLGARAVGSGLGSLLGGTAASAPTLPTPPEAPSQPRGGLLGGLSGVLQSFQQSGHGDVINSWIGHGQNQPIAPDQLHQALGPDAVNNLSRLTGLPQDQLLAELSRVLPGVVDKLTPNGRMPDQAEVSRW